MATTFKKPSQLVHHIKVEAVADWTLFKFNPALKVRLEALLTKSEYQLLTPEESAELDAIQELQTIFAYINNQMAGLRRNRLRSQL